MAWGRRRVIEARHSRRDTQVCGEMRAKTQRLLRNYARRILNESGKRLVPMPLLSPVFSTCFLTSLVYTVASIFFSSPL